MRIYEVRSDTICLWGRNSKAASKLRTLIKREFGEVAEISEHEVPRNKDGLVELLNNVT